MATKSVQQLDWRWIERYRQLTSYDSYWWWAQAGSLMIDEQAEWNQLITQELDETTKEHLNKIIVQSRTREIATALLEQREPRFQYPVLNHCIDDVRVRIHDLKQLNQEIQQVESDRTVRWLYHDTLSQEVDFLHLIETAYTGDSDRYWEITRLLYPLPTLEEMQYPLEKFKTIALEGLHYIETTQISQELIQHMRENLHLSELITDDEIAHELEHQGPLPPSEKKRNISAQTAKKFFEQILQDAGYTTWKVEIDAKGGARVESALRTLYLADDTISLERVRHLLAHEVAGHVARSTAGEQSPLGILAIGTAGYMATEEGLALYNERQVATLHHEEFDDSGTCMCMVAVGFARGVITPPQTFSALLRFFELLHLQRRLFYQFDDDLETAKKLAKKRAISRCLRTFRGVPDLNIPGIVYSKDVVYWRGVRLIQQAVAQDETILDRLAVGKIALEQLDNLRELNLIAPPQLLRERAFDSGLDEYILSFEEQK